jgi:hypothetical protein
MPIQQNSFTRLYEPNRIMPLPPDNTTDDTTVIPSDDRITIQRRPLPNPFYGGFNIDENTIVTDSPHEAYMEGVPMPNEITPEENPEVVKRVAEPMPENPETTLLSAKLTRNASGLTLMLRSPILENFFKVMANGITYTAGSTRRWKITQPHLLGDNNSLAGPPRWAYPNGTSTLWLVDGLSVNLQILTTVGLGSGVNLTSEIPMTRDAMKTLLENLKGAAKEIYLSFCTPVEGEINLAVTEKLSTGSIEVQDR